jgi:hypothetical protein
MVMFTIVEARLEGMQSRWSKRDANRFVTVLGADIINLMLASIACRLLQPKGWRGSRESAPAQQL